MPVEYKPPSSGGILQQTIVVFSKNYLPVARINIRRAIVLLVTGQAECLDFGNTQSYTVRSPSVALTISEHIRLTQGSPTRHWKVPGVSRRELFKRDGHRCQYCGSNRSLTIDHVMPRSKGGTHTWDNVVTACARCNSMKGDRLLAELPHMTLRHPPKAPINPVVAFADQFWKSQSG